MTDTIHSGLAAQCMIVSEATYGTYVAPTRSLEFVSEGMKTTIERIESKGLRAGRRIVGKWLPGKTSSAGELTAEVNGIGFGLVLQHMLGTCAITGPTDTVAYTMTATPTDLPVGFTMQLGKPSIDGTVQPFTYTGCRINTWELSLKAGELLELKLGVVAQAETDLTATHALTTCSHRDKITQIAIIVPSEPGNEDALSVPHRGPSAKGCMLRNTIFLGKNVPAQVSSQAV